MLVKAWRHRLDPRRSPELGSQATKLCSKVSITKPQAARRHLQGIGGSMVGGQSSLANDLGAADFVVGTETEPGNKMVLRLPFAHVPSYFAEEGRRGHNIDAINLGEILARHAK